MLGNLPQTGRFNDRIKRYQEIVQRSNNKSSVSVLPVGSTFESTISGQSFNSTVLQNSNAGLSTRQFYQQNKCNSGSSHVRETNIPLQHSVASSTVSSQSHFYRDESNLNFAQNRAPSAASSVDASSAVINASEGCFKVPQVPKKLSYWPWIRKKIEILSPLLREIEDKKSLHFIFRMFEQTVHSVRYPPLGQPVNPLVLIDHITKSVIEDYYAGKVLKPLCSAPSFISDQTSTLELTGNGPRYAPSDVDSLSHFGSSLERVMNNVAQDTRSSSASVMSQSMRPQTNQQQMEISSMVGFRHDLDRQGERSINQMNTQPVVVIERRNSRPSANQKQTDTIGGNESGLNLFTDSAIAQRRDEAAAGRTSLMSEGEISTRVNKKVNKKLTTKPKIDKSTVSRRKSNNRLSTNLDSQAEESICKSNNGSPSDDLAVSRRGRPLKPPVNYWNSKGNETISNGTIVYKEINPLNDSMTLRNHKVVDKKKTPPLKGKTPPLSVIPENKTITKTATKSQPRRKTPGSDDKENSVVQKRKYERKNGKKANDTAVLKESSSKGRTNKKKEETIQEQAAKKIPQKRKSKESDTTASKKRKTAENSIADVSDVDDLFGNSHFKRKPSNVIQALSPSSGMMSAKKAVAGVASEKVTPPCKVISHMINSSHISAVSSVRGAPNVKENEAMKRLIKKVEKEQNKPQSKQQKGKTKQKPQTQEDLELEKILNEAVKVSTYTVNTPLSSGTITCFRGTEPESVSENSDMEDDDDLI